MGKQVARQLGSAMVTRFPRSTVRSSWKAPRHDGP
jgi:hypothetical protein